MLAEKGRHRVNFSNLSQTDIEKLRQAPQTNEGYLVIAALGVLESFNRNPKSDETDLILDLTPKKYNFIADVLGWQRVAETREPILTSPDGYVEDVQRHPEDIDWIP